jgi:hypothetical protein
MCAEKVFKRLGFVVSKPDVDGLVNCVPGVVERVLMVLQVRGWLLKVFSARPAGCSLVPYYAVPLPWLNNPTIAPSPPPPPPTRPPIHPPTHPPTHPPRRPQCAGTLASFLLAAAQAKMAVYQQAHGRGGGSDSGSPNPVPQQQQHQQQKQWNAPAASAPPPPRSAAPAPAGPRGPAYDAPAAGQSAAVGGGRGAAPGRMPPPPPPHQQQQQQQGHEQYEAAAFAMQKDVDTEILVEKVQTIQDLRETVEVSGLCACVHACRCPCVPCVAHPAGSLIAVADTTPAGHR